jgi:hypothetical protein
MVSQKVTWKWDSVYEKKKKKKKKKNKKKKLGSAPIGPTSMLTFPLFAKKKRRRPKKAAKIIM